MGQPQLPLASCASVFGFFSPPDQSMVALRKCGAACLCIGIFTGLMQHLNLGGVFSFSCPLGLEFSWFKLLLCLVLGMGNRITMLEKWYHKTSIGDSALQPWEQALHFLQMPLHIRKGRFLKKTQAV